MLEVKELETAVVGEAEARGRDLGAILTAQGLAQCHRVAMAVDHREVSRVLAHLGSLRNRVDDVFRDRTTG